jgi:hypothetical protein
VPAAAAPPSVRKADAHRCANASPEGVVESPHRATEYRTRRPAVLRASVPYAAVGRGDPSVGCNNRGVRIPDSTTRLPRSRRGEVWRTSSSFDVRSSDGEPDLVEITSLELTHRPHCRAESTERGGGQGEQEPSPPRRRGGRDIIVERIGTPATHRLPHDQKDASISQSTRPRAPGMDRGCASVRRASVIERSAKALQPISRKVRC